MQTTSNVIDKNWKALIKPNKLDITSNEDKTIAKIVAEPRKGFGQIGNCYENTFTFYSRSCGNGNSN